MEQFRQGDVFIQRVETLPEGLIEAQEGNKRIVLVQNK